MQARVLVSERIPGTRKGSAEPAYLHSWRVGDALAQFGYAEEVVVAGTLHDVVEDGDVTFEDLRTQGFSSKIVSLVDLCTHDLGLEYGDARWVKMIARLVDAQDVDAWAIKLADLADNVKGSRTMPEDRRRFMREVKAPLLLRVSEPWMGKTAPWSALAQTIEDGVR